MSKKKIYILVGVVVTLIIVLVTLKSKGIIGSNDDSKQVETSKVDEITIIETVSATGKIQPEIEVKISSEVSGEIIALPVKEGQVVKKGDLLVKIDKKYFRPCEVDLLLGDPTKSKNLLGWNITYNIDELIDDMFTN